MSQELDDKLAFFREVLNEREPEPGDPEDRYEPSPLSEWGKQAIRELVLIDPPTSVNRIARSRGVHQLPPARYARRVGSKHARPFAPVPQSA